ncbi:spore germination protein GerKA [Desulfocucumis palustris]|uniref:Spore germination protein GerKA n=1 Tax=Desulfocucumis palustris TaxID=1898651 RepID=A0A2L2XFU3_9FIRM|nr:spore germination protein [Desulfocucumis palustris]GBF35207.1 spore germination protein GerKA [Desulfocucumis palustris]
MRRVTRHIKGGCRNKAKIPPGSSNKDSSAELDESLLLTENLTTNLFRIKQFLIDCSDIVYREFLFAQREDIRLVMIYTDGLADKSQLSDQIMRALSLELPLSAPQADITRSGAYHLIKERGVCVHQIKETNRLDEIIEAILSGDTVLLVEGNSTAIINGARGWESRSISEPDTEVIVRGPREAFVENLSTNTAMLRRKLKSHLLKIEALRLGRISKTDVVIIYIKGVANEKLVTEVKRRLRKIDLDGILGSGYIEELIEDNPWSPFPQINHTERPDRMAARLLEGRVGIMVDGTPFALTVPNVFIEYLQAPEDYYERFYFATGVRIIRFAALVLSLTAPSLYVAIITFHQEMLPTPLLLSIAAQRESVPYPAIFEVLFMELSFEILREAGIRLPRQIGQAVSIVGALIIGEAAVRAGLVASATVIVVAITGISSFVFFYSASIAIRMLRFPIMMASAALGLFGLISSIIVLVLHLCSLRSFGIPYLSPVAPISVGDMKDVVLRVPWWAMYNRPRLIGWKNPRRLGPEQKPDFPEVKNRGGAGDA